MYQVVDGCRWSGEKTLLLRDVFLFGEEGIPLTGNSVINRFVNFKDDQLLIWLLHHENKELVHLEGVVLPLYGDWSFNFWHWLNESLPVAFAAHEGGFSGTYLVPPNPFAADSLKFLGIPAGRIRAVEDCDYHLDCMCLLPKFRGGDGTDIANRMRIARALREPFVRSGAGERLYISRNGHPDNMRKVVNEKELLAFLERYDFRVLRLEELTLEEQLSHTCNATALLGPHGAGMAHCAFMPPGSLVVELFAPTYINPCVMLPCRQLRHRYYQMTSHCIYDGYHHGYDVMAQLDALEMTLERELSLSAI